MRFQPPDNKADYGDCVALQKKLENAADHLSEMAQAVALARHVREYDSDRRRRCLAIAAAPLLKAGLSSAAADTEARASEVYAQAMKQLGTEFVAAEKTLAEWDATRIQVEVARSLLAMQRDTMKNL